jgi:hypothetical protein
MECHENKLEIAHRFRRRDTDSHNRLGGHPWPRDSLSHRVVTAAALGAASIDIVPESPP